MILKRQRIKVIETAIKAREEKLVPLTMGNFSLRDKKTGYLCITPSGLEYTRMKPKNVVVMDVDGNIIDGDRPPSIENPLHRAIYRKRPDVFGIVHTHSTFSVAWSCCNKPIPEAAAEMVSTLGGPVECAPFRPMGTLELAEITSNQLGKKTAILMANHGLIAVGPDIDRAFINAFIVEEGAKIAYFAQHIGEIKMIPETERKFLYRAFEKLYKDN